MLPCCVSTAFKVTLVKGRSPRAGIAGTWGRNFEMGPELRGAPGSAMLLGGVFTIACALAKDIQTLIICRFFVGVCAASQLTVVPG